MNRIAFAFCAALVASAAFAAPITEDATIEGHFMKVVITTDYGCTVQDFIFSATGENYASGNGMLEEGFGVGNYYVPNRRLNEQLAFRDDITDRPVLRFAYECDGPNIAGIHGIRTMEPLPDEAGMRVTWRLEHRGEDTQWVAPWVRLDWLPGGAVDGGDRMDVPTLNGILDPEASGYHRASRNWVAATDPAKKTTVYAVFNANDAFAYLVERETEGDGLAAVQTHFVPWAFEPGATWETTYRVNVVRGLEHINFATDELAAQIDYENGQLVLRLASPRALPPMEINATVIGPDGAAVNLPSKKFQLDPNKVVRCTYEWTAPGPGAYDFLAQVTSGGRPYTLGKETASPHGGIDGQFVVGEIPVRYEGWTDGPYRLERAGRKLSRTLAADGPAQVWVESPLEKLMPEDGAVATGPLDRSVRLAMAKNEAESFQVALRPTEDAEINVRIGPLEGADGTVLPADGVRIYRVDHVNVDIPSYFEGPTGLFPDGLRPYAPFLAPGGETSLLWVTVRAPADFNPGTYTGVLEIMGVDAAPLELIVTAEVFDFALPAIPALKTDFGLDLDAAAAQLRAEGFAGNADAVWTAHADLAAAQRITFRDIASLPAESADYARSLAGFESKLSALQARGISSLYVPHSLLDAPEQLALANAFVEKHGLADRAFTQLAATPPPTAWQAVYEASQKWKAAAPSIRPMMTNYGLQPFLSDAAPIWAVHAPMLDTTNNKAILEYPGAGGEVWWFVNHSPPRPYANFFVDFAPIEHRVLFWQTWALGFKGVHYWSANFAEEGQDPWESQLDITPVNGDGFLVYPTPQGPMPSLRLEIIRDGIEDFDYLTLLSTGIDALKRQGGNAAVLAQAEAARNLQAVMPNLVSFTRDPAELQTKRRELAEAIVAVQAALR